MKFDLKTTIDWYDKNAKEYEKNTVDLIDFDQIEEFCGYLPKKAKILDAGCGFGRDSKVFFDRKYDVTGVDLSKSLLKIAKEKYPQINFVKANLLKLPFENKSFDGVWAHASLVHFEKDNEIKKVLDEFNRVLKPNGILYTSVKIAGSREREEEKRSYRYYEPGEWHVFLEMSGFLIEKMYLDEDRDKDNNRKVGWIVALSKKF